MSFDFHLSIGHYIVFSWLSEFVLDLLCKKMCGQYVLDIWGNRILCTGGKVWNDLQKEVGNFCSNRTSGNSRGWSKG